MAEVFVVHITQIDDCVELRNDVRLFSKEEDAKNYAKEFIKDERNELSQNIEDGYWIESDDFEKSWSWECYEDGAYCENHTELSVTKEEVY